MLILWIFLAFKPWPSRSAPSATAKKSPRKEKSIHTLKNPSITSKSSRENKENKTSSVIKETVSSSERNLGIEIGSVDNNLKDEKKNACDNLNSDIKTVLDRLDETVQKLSSEMKKPSDLDKGIVRLICLEPKPKYV